MPVTVDSKANEHCWSSYTISNEAYPDLHRHTFFTVSSWFNGKYVGTSKLETLSLLMTQGLWLDWKVGCFRFCFVEWCIYLMNMIDTWTLQNLYLGCCYNLSFFRIWRLGLLGKAKSVILFFEKFLTLLIDNWH